MNKAISLSHLNITFNLASSELSWQWFRRGDVVLAVLPFFHIYGATQGMSLNIFMNIPFVLLPRFVPEAFLVAIDKYKVTVSNISVVPTGYCPTDDCNCQALPLVPPLINFLALSPSVDQYDLRSLRVVCAGAAPVIPGTCDKFIERFAKRGIRIELGVGYGLTESSA